VKEIEHDTDADLFKEEHDVAIIGFFDKDSEAYKAFAEAATEVDDVPFALVVDNGIRKLLRGEPNSFILYKKFDEKRIVYEGELNRKDIAEFATMNAMRLVVPFNEANAAKIFGGAVQVHLLVFLDAAKDEQIVNELSEPAKANRGKALVVTIGPEEEQIMEYFGVTVADMPAVRLVDMRDAGMKKYTYDKPVIDQASVETFLEDFFEGRLQSTLKSEEEPTTQSGPVKVIVSKTFQSEVVNGDKDVLVKFYAPWCGHCKELAPKYEALALKLKDKPHIVLAKVNSEANEIKDIEVKGFPTLRLWPGENKHSPVEYTGERTEEAIEAWLEKELGDRWKNGPPVNPATEPDGAGHQWQKKEDEL